jgi:hypothetical protein
MEVIVVPTGLMVNIRMDPVNPADCQMVSTLEEAEDIILALPQIIDHDVETHDDNVPERYAGFLTQAMLYGNQIASTTRRGGGSGGSVILMGRDAFAKVEEAYEVLGKSGLDAVTPQTVGRWEKKGTVFGNTVIYVGDALPNNEVFVAYVGGGNVIDGPGGLITDNGDLYLRLLGGSPDTAAPYTRRFRLLFK